MKNLKFIRTGISFILVATMMITSAITFVSAQGSDAIVFEDENFQNYVCGVLGKPALSDIYPADVADITTINCANKGITSLKGIEYFGNLESLTCYTNQLSNLDLSRNTALTYLSCYKNQLSSLDLSNNTALEYLNCSINPLGSLDVSNNTSLATLWCYDDQLGNLDLSNNSNLTTLWCYDNQLEDLDLSNNTALTELYCYNNQLDSIDVSNNTALTILRCYDNNLEHLDLSNNTALIRLHCNDNQLNNLDLSNNPGLSYLYCGNNQLRSLDLSNNTKLKFFYGQYNYFPDESFVIGVNKLDFAVFLFEPQTFEIITHKIKNTETSRVKAVLFAETNEGPKPEICEDEDGGRNMAFLEAGGLMTYYAEVETSGYYKVNVRASSSDGRGWYELHDRVGEGTVKLGAAKAAHTGGWQNWETVPLYDDNGSDLVYLAKGEHILDIKITQGGTNLNWFEFTLEEPMPISGDISIDENFEIKAISLPTDDSDVYDPNFIIKSTGAENKLTLIVASYDADGRLVGYDIIPKTLGTFGRAIYSPSIDKASNTATFKFFIWNNGFVPLTEITSIEEIVLLTKITPAEEMAE